MLYLKLANVALISILIFTISGPFGIQLRRSQQHCQGVALGANQNQNHGQQDQLASNGRKDGPTNGGQDTRMLLPAMRILALFSSTTNDLGLDHRLGRQVLKLAASRAQQLHPELSDLELIIKSDETECTSLNTIPSIVAEQFYSNLAQDLTKCTAPSVANDQERAVTKEPYQNNNTTINSCSFRQNDDLKELNLYLNQEIDWPSYSANGSETTSNRWRRYLSPTEQQQQLPSAAAKKIDAIIGPSCDFLVDLIARMAAYWQTPIYSVTSISDSFNRKDIYSTLTRLSPSIDHLSMFIVRTMEKFRWRHLAIIVDEKQVENVLLLENLDRIINRLRYSIPIKRKVFKFNSIQMLKGDKGLSNNETTIGAHVNGDNNGIKTKSLCSLEAHETLLEAQKEARVYLFLINDQLVVRRLLLCASELHMNNGEFTFLALNLGLKSAEVKTIEFQTERTNSPASLSPPLDLSDESSVSDQIPAPTKSKLAGQRTTQNFDWYSAEDEENNSIARQMFESLMVFSVDLPISDEYSVFVEQTLDMVHQEYPDVEFKRASVGAVAAALHDSLLLAVEAYTRHHNRRQLSTDGSSVGGGTINTKQKDSSPKVNLEFQSMTSNNNVDDDDNADDIPDDKDQVRLETKVPLMWNERFLNGLISGMHINSNGDQELDYVLSDLEPEMGLMRPVASYSKELRQIELLPNSYIHWPKRVNSLTRQMLDKEEPPPDEPECGFNDDAERCVDRQNLHAALSIIGIIMLLVIISTTLSLYKYRQIKYQMQLDDYWWRINWADLRFIQYTDSILSGPASVARAVRSGGSVVSGYSGEGASSFISTIKMQNRLSNQLPEDGDTSAHGASNRLTAQGNKRARSKAVPVIVTSPEVGDIIHEPPDALLAQRPSTIGDNLSVHSGNRTVASLAAGGSCIIRSEYSSVVRASNLAIYKNELVIVKQLNSSSLEISRNLLVELKSMRDHLNENLAKFIGLCIEPERLSIVYEFCSRGSLQDLLLNQDVSMDWTLKYSILGDILSGLNFIHTTLLDYHGRLKSTNLVLDSRFTVKVTDFGLQNLYSQLKGIKDYENDQLDDEDNDDNDRQEEADGDAATHRRVQHDQLSLSVSQAAYNMESVSVVGSRRKQGGGSKLYFKNRGAARFFWTAPEHLRDINAHFVGSKKGDIYSFAIILTELFTRKEPYHYGTNAKPHWEAIKSERKIYQQLHAQPGGGSGSDTGNPTSALKTGRRSVSRPGRDSVISSSAMSAIGSQIGRQSRKAQGKLRQSTATVGPYQQQQQQQEQQTADSGAIAEVASIVSLSAQSQASSQLSGGNPCGGGDSVIMATPHTNSAASGHDKSQALKINVGAFGKEEQPVKGSVENSSLNARERQQHQTNNKQANADKAARLDAEKILDQLRMGIQPEPVRPYLPNNVVQDVDPKLLELMRSCWAELPGERPNLSQVRASLRRITKGMASKNYLDNLLDRLQNYAAELERIVDAKSSDIMVEKFRTEELLFQLVPKFVADRLKRNEPIVPQVFDGVTIFFSDIVGFEKYASVMGPGELVDLLNNIYSSFESIITSFDVTKIETIIDQFLVASGISLQQEQSPIGRIEQEANQQQANSGNGTANGAASNCLSAAVKGAINQAGKSGDRSLDEEKVLDSSGNRSGGRRFPKLSRKNKLLGSLRISHGSSDNKQGSLDLPGSGQEQTSTAPGGANDESSQPMAMSARPTGLDLNHYRRSSAEQIARMALCIRDLVKSFHFRQNLSGASGAAQKVTGTNEMAAQDQARTGGNIVATAFNIRIGIHSGKVCAGIVGVKRPKFCLIGDTVNVASRMHTNSKANRIQISGDTKQLLEYVPGFSIEPRGKIEVKGKGMMETFWLESSY